MIMKDWLTTNYTFEQLMLMSNMLSGIVGFCVAAGLWMLVESVHEHRRRKNGNA